jgi:hypothetical protein
MMVQTSPYVAQRLMMLAAVSLALGPPMAKAGSVVPMSLDVVSDHAGQVIAGKIASIRSYWADNPRRIESEVVFEQVDYLKGALPDSGSTFRLTVPGGTVGQMGMRIAGAPEFATGQEWVLFLLPTYKTFPVVGLSQGAFRIVADGDGIKRVHSASGAPFVGVDASLKTLTARVQRLSATTSLIDGMNVRVKPVPEERDTAEGLTYAEFLAQIRPILEKTRDHRLSEPAGRRVPVEYTPVPMASAPARADVNQIDKGRRCQSTERQNADAHMSVPIVRGERSRQ